MSRNHIIVLLLACTVPLTVQATVAMGDIYESFTEPIRTHEIASIETGRVAEVLVQLGTYVSAGEPLVQLDSSLLQASKKLAAAKAKPGAKLRAMKVELDAKTHRLQQLGELLDSGAGNQEEVRRAIVDVDVARLNVEAAKEEITLAKLQLQEIEAKIDQRRIRSPREGLVTDIYYQVGEYVSAQAMQCLKLVDVQTILATFHLPTAEALDFEEGDIVEISLPESEETVRATVSYVGKITEAESGRVRVDVTIDNATGGVRSGVRCVLDTELSSKQDR
jgi:RND family efflux transporter MFP subunit